VQPELRRSFHEQLAAISGEVSAMTKVVEDGLDRVTEALLSGNREMAARIIAGDAPLDDIYAATETEIHDLIARQAPVARDLRFVLAALRIAQEVERCGDLVASIARRAGRLDQDVLTAEIRAIVYEMGAEALGMFHTASTAFDVLDESAAARLGAWDDIMDDLHRRMLLAVFALRDVSLESAVELGLIARFYERIADHAVVIAERVCFAASGAMHPGDADESSPDLS
jgi:phosphate transport system protein